MVAIDQRGYNLSDKPKGVENYDMRLLVGDVAAVIKHLERDKATIVGHDWGGMVAWQFALNLPAMTEHLIVLNLPHPSGLLRELKSNPEQIKNSEYARDVPARIAERSEGVLRQPDDAPDAVGMGQRPGRAEALRRSVRALRLRRHAELLQANYPATCGADTPAPPEFPKVSPGAHVPRPRRSARCTRTALAGTWDWLEKDLTLVTVPGAGHFVQQDAAELVTSTMQSWLEARNR